MPHQRLLVFMGETQREVTLHKYSRNVTTDENGSALLQLPREPIQWVQVFADFRTLCQTEPSRRAFSLSEVVSNGEATPNDCGSLRKAPKPNQVIIFARPAIFKERLAW